MVLDDSNTFTGELSVSEVTTFVDIKKLGVYTGVSISTPESRERDKISELNKQLRSITNK